VRGACIDPPGYDAGKKIKGKKRHVLVDTQGQLMHAIVHAADIQDRDGGALLIASLFGAFPFLVKLCADAGYQGPQFQSAMKRILAQDHRRDRQAIGPSQRVRHSAKALDRRTHPRLARPLPQTGQGLGIQSQGARLPAPRLHPSHAAKAMQSRMMFPDRL
jgi:hypothetical protein